MSSDHPYPRVGVATFVMKDGQFLMCLRGGSHAANTWGLPGGKLDLGESWEDCARREIAEEVGVEAENFAFVAATNDLFKEENLHYVTIFMRADWISGEPQVLEPEKCREWRWFTYDTMPEKQMLPIQNLRKTFPDLQV
ncbi:MAG TPA: NUDIX domain-containing protein [Candidatus Saccharimonadales bacterium]|nr:NUDIX domain-containing protein [Candidatus Saccharimonadales bacterium]